MSLECQDPVCACSSNTLGLEPISKQTFVGEKYPATICHGLHSIFAKRLKCCTDPLKPPLTADIQLSGTPARGNRHPPVMSPDRLQSAIANLILLLLMSGRPCQTSGHRASAPDRLLRVRDRAECSAMATGRFPDRLRILPASFPL